MPASRLLTLPVGRTPPTVGNYTFRQGRGYVIRKSPNAALVYGVDLKDWLADAATGLERVEIESARGVSAQGKPFIQGTIVGVLVGGLSLQDGATNSITFLFTCADGQQDTVTIYFEKG